MLHFLSKIKDLHTQYIYIYYHQELYYWKNQIQNIQCIKQWVWYIFKYSIYLQQDRNSRMKYYQSYIYYKHLQFNHILHNCRRVLLQHIQQKKFLRIKFCHILQNNKTSCSSQYRCWLQKIQFIQNNLIYSIFQFYLLKYLLRVYQIRKFQCKQNNNQQDFSHHSQIQPSSQFHNQQIFCNIYLLIIHTQNHIQYKLLKNYNFYSHQQLRHNYHLLLYKVINIIYKNYQCQV